MHPPLQGDPTGNAMLAADTPEEYFPSTDCTERDSCPFRPDGQGNRDPIHNYMVR